MVSLIVVEAAAAAVMLIVFNNAFKIFFIKIYSCQKYVYEKKECLTDEPSSIPSNDYTTVLW